MIRQIWIIFVTLLVVVMNISTSANELNYKSKRVPAEFEPQEAIWMQWPGYWEKDYEITFAKMVSIISRYEKLHILYNSDQVYADAQKAISETKADPQNQKREPIEGFVKHNDQMFDTNYMNWLVGNGFVIVPAFGNLETDILAKARIESYFPDRDVYLIEMLSSWVAGGRVYYHTNDQPTLPLTK